MGYCREKCTFRWKKMQDIWYLEDIVGTDILKSDFAEYDFEENKEWTLGDYEFSPLSQIIFGAILSMYLGDYDYLINRYYTFIFNRDTKEKHRILFDVMNNPKFNVGKKEEYRYHKIANFVFLPGKSLHRSLQFVHRDKDERWDEMLRYLRENWNILNNLPLKSFNEYIKASCQHIYYCCVYEKIKEYNIDECDMDELLQTIDNLVDETGNDAEFVLLDKKEVIEEIISMRGRILLHKFRKAVEMNIQKSENREMI